MRHVLALSLCLLVGGGVALGDDVLPPDWRGMDRTVVAGWWTWEGLVQQGWSDPDYWDSTPQLPAIPEMGSVPYAFDAGSSLLTTVLDEFQGRQEVLEVRQDWGIALYLPNFADGEWKEVWIQITYWNGPDLWPGWYSQSGQVIGGDVEAVIDHGDGWRTVVMWMDFVPNPLWEVVSAYEVTGRYPIYIEQIVVDTICPEPHAAALLALGALALLRRRRGRPRTSAAPG